MCTRIKLCFLLFFCIGQGAWSQIPGMRRYTQFDGFTASTGYLIDQDDEGVLWIGTDNGGMRFDGKKFSVLQQLRHSSDVDIISCSPIGKDRILLVPLNYNLRLLEKGKLITAKEDLRLMDTVRRDLNTFNLDPVTGARWVSNNLSTQMLHRFSGDDFRVYRVPLPGFRLRYIFNNCIIGLKDDYVQGYSLQTGARHYFYDESGKRIRQHLQNELLSADCGLPYIFMFNQVSGKIDIYRYVEGDSILHLTRTLNLPAGVTTSFRMSIDALGRVWLVFLGKGGIVYYGHVTQNTGDGFFRFMQPMALNSLFIDRNRNLWMTSRNNILYFLSQKHFQNALLTKNFPQRRETPKVISGDQRDQLLIGYINSNELISIDKKGQQSIRLKPSFDQGIRKILPTGDGRYLLCAAGIALFDPAHYNLQYLKSIRYTKDFCLYKEKGLLASSMEGLFYYPSFTSTSGEKKLFEGRCTAVGVLKGNKILIGTSNGMYILPGLNGVPVKTNDSVLQESYITNLLQMADGSMLVGTNARGLYRYAADGRVSAVQTAAQQPERIYDLYRQNDSVYWVASDNGAWRLQLGKEGRLQSAQNYTFYDGLPSNNVNSVFVRRDTAYVATADGIGIILFGDSAQQPIAAPEIYLNTVQTRNLSFRKPVGQINLDHTQHDLQLNLSIISYESLGNLHYYYRLYPLQQEWIQATEPEIRFTQLPPGQYEFQAYARNARGIKSRKGITLKIVIRPAFWQTYYFIAAVFLVTAALLFLCLRSWILRRERKRLEKIQGKKKLAELELEAIKAQINPHFIYNCLNSIQYLNYKAEYEQAQRYLDLFARVIRMTMQYSRQAFVSLHEEIGYLSLYLQLEKLRFKDKLEYEIETAPGVDQSIRLPAMLLQPYVENALKHGVSARYKGRLIIRFDLAEDRLVVTIQDNGAGFSGQNRPGALGLRLSGTRAFSYNELFNLNISIHASNLQDRIPGTTGAEIRIEMKYFLEPPIG